MIKTLRDEWVEHGGFSPPLVGCTVNELNQLKTSQQVNRLPDLYTQFMCVFGKESGGLRHGGQYHFPQALTFKQHWKPALPESDCFVFVSNNDDMALFFHTEDVLENPMVYRIFETIDSDKQSFHVEPYCKLSDFLIDWVQEEIETYNKWNT